MFCVISKFTKSANSHPQIYIGMGVEKVAAKNLIKPGMKRNEIKMSGLGRYSVVTDDSEILIITVQADSLVNVL